MSHYWILECRVGPYVWTVESADAADPEIEQILSGLDAGWAMPDADVLPAQPDPMDASFQMLVPDIAALEDADVGSHCHVLLGIDPSSSASSWFAFFGRVTDMTAVPRKSGGMTVSVTAVDYTVDERPVGLVDWPSENVPARLARIWAEAGAGAVPALPLAPWADLLPPREAARTTLPAHLEEILPTWIGQDGDGNWARYILSPRAYVADGADTDVSALDPARQFMLDPLTNIGPPPLAFGAGPGGYGLSAAPDPANLILDAGFVRRGVQWTRRKFGALDALLITDADSITRGIAADGRYLNELNEGALVDASAVAQLTSPFAFAGGTVEPDLFYYLDATKAVGNRWEIDSLVYELSEDIEAGNLDTDSMLGDPQGWFPQHNRSEATRARCYARTVAIAGIPAAQNPSATPLYIGQLRGARVRIERGRIRIDFKVRRSLPKIDPAQGLTPAGLAASAYAAVRVDQLDPQFTVYDYRLAKEA